jgi:hypothetical protein
MMIHAVGLRRRSDCDAHGDQVRATGLGRAADRTAVNAGVIDTGTPIVLVDTGGATHAPALG